MKFCRGRRAGTALLFACLIFSGSNAQVSPQGVLVWHFDQGIANLWGGMYNVFELEPSAARTYLDSTTHRPGAAHSLRITAHREPAGFCGVWLEFIPPSASNRRFLDASPYQFLSFWIQGKIAGESFELTLEDDTAQRPWVQKSTVALRSYLLNGTSDQWQEVMIPLRDFPRLNLRRLVRLTLNLTAPGDSRFFIDDVGFKADRSAVLPAPANLASLRHTALRKPHRAMWVWNTSDLLASEEESNRFFDFCSNTAVKQVYLSLNLDTTLTPSGIRFALREPDAFRHFLDRAHRQNVEVEALTGTPEWAARENHATALAAVGAVIRFNRASPRPARFDGVHFDVEPYSLLGYGDAAHARVLLGNFLVMTSLCSRRIHAQPGLRFTSDVPAYFFPSSSVELQRLLVKFDGKDKTVGEHLTSLLDYVTIMDYQHEADGAGGVIASALPALRYAASQGKKIRVGIETSVEPESTFFFVCGLPRDEFRNRLAASPLGDQLTLGGWRLSSISDDINVHVGLAAPANLEGTERASFNQALVHLARHLGAASDPDHYPASEILEEARAALAQNPEWKGFETFELTDPETQRTIQGFRCVHRMAAKTTFYDLGRETFEEETRSIEEWLSPFSSYAGLAIHHYQSYRILLDGK